MQVVCGEKGQEGWLSLNPPQPTRDWLSQELGILWSWWPESRQSLKSTRSKKPVMQPEGNWERYVCEARKLEDHAKQNQEVYVCVHV